jgi:putative PIN family toxin of toxin-antitoxin system
VPLPYRVVLDTNVLLRALINFRSNSGRVVDACDRRSVVLLLSRPVLAEYRHILTAQEVIERYPELTPEKVELVLRRLRYVGDFIRSVRANFEYARDPMDEKFIELAIAAEASHIVTGDNDLLSLTSGRGEAAKRFRQRSPSLRVVDATTFLRDLRI